ncbi:MAG: hypothetical protein KTR17_08320, partial [Cellvibrionaceae bacterium]|nr:hypothetical protein [Cellvibrionaceae bacterium]
SNSEAQCRLLASLSFNMMRRNLHFFKPCLVNPAACPGIASLNAIGCDAQSHPPCAEERQYALS